MGASIRDHLVVKAKVEEDFVKEEGCDPFYSDGFLCGAENHPLSKLMVNHDQKRVKAIGRGKISDEIAGDLLEWVSGDGVNRSEGGNSRVHVGFVLLENSATINIFMNKGSEARPPEFRGNQLIGFEIARMAGSLVVMASGENGFLKREVRGYIDTALVDKDSLSMLPVREMGAENGGNGPSID